MKKTKRDEWLIVRCSPAEKAAISEAAKQNGKTVSDFIRQKTKTKAA